jgi:transcription initiation factor TFIID subunit TAF12
VVDLEKKLKSNVTENQVTGTWLIQKRGKNSKKWTTIGNPHTELKVAKDNVDYMQTMSPTGREWNWRAVNEDGLTYAAKASR